MKLVSELTKEAQKSAEQERFAKEEEKKKKDEQERIAKEEEEKAKKLAG